MTAACAADVQAAAAPPGESVTFASLPGFAADDHRAAFRTFRVGCTAFADEVRPVRAAVSPPSGLAAVCARARTLRPDLDEAAARVFFETNFTARRIADAAFFTGYYEPVVEGSPTPTATFRTPLYPFPADVRSMPDRAAIEAGALAGLAEPLVYVREAVDAFFIQVQGSARISLPDKSLRRLVYAGRNGFPYTSIGKVLVDTLHIPPADMGMAQLRAWICAHGQGPGEAGTLLMQRNRSYIFFRFDDTLGAGDGPIGGAGVSLTPLRSLAVDRTLWPYGLPFFVDATMPWTNEQATPFQRLMVAQDTGSAIRGAARADIFFGTGAAAAARAGAIRHPGTLYVLWPKNDSGQGAAP